MNYLEFMRKVDGRPEPEVNLNRNHYYHGEISRRNTGSIQNCLGADDNTYLMDAFVWASTPQGHAHWAYIHYGGCTLTEEDRSYLKYLLREHT